MKKGLILAVVTAAFVFTGCGQSETVISGDVNNQTQSSAKSEASEQASTAEVASEGYVFEYNGTKIVIDAEAADIVAALGDPVSYYEVASCAFGELDKFYTYADFELDTYCLDGVDYVQSVILLNDNLATAEGLALGDSVEKMEKLYGPANGDASTTYDAGNMKLTVFYSNSAVTDIQYLTKVLDQ